MHLWQPKSAHPHAPLIPILPPFATPQANVVQRLRTAMDDGGNATAREGALLAIKGLLVSVARSA